MKCVNAWFCPNSLKTLEVSKHLKAVWTMSCLTDPIHVSALLPIWWSDTVWLHHTLAFTVEEPFCERTFDGWTCFNDTPAGQVVYFQCPNFIYGFNPQSESLHNANIGYWLILWLPNYQSDLAHKTCTPEGKWKVHHETLQPWTNYTSCVDIPDLYVRKFGMITSKNRTIVT